MKIDTLGFEGAHWRIDTAEIDDRSACQLVTLFGDSAILRGAPYFEEMRALYPNAHIIGASSSGNIQGAAISACPAVAAAVSFEQGSVAVSRMDFSSGDDIQALAAELIDALPAEGLKHIFLLSDGLNLNGSELVRGVNQAAGGIPVSGGLAGDGDRFEQTWVIADAPARQNRVVALGLYGDNLIISTGCHGGWSPFGAERLVTRSDGNVLYELDHQPALELYKTYLGEFAADLPNSGMRFPLEVYPDGDNRHTVTRTLLAIDEAANSITFAGDIPKGHIAKLMKPDIDQLIEGAAEAARAIDNANRQSALGLVVSCVGRRVVMRQIVEEELEEVEEILGDNVKLVGFYSYGEIAPFNDRPEQCQLHNQTMTLTAIYEQPGPTK